MKTPFRSAAISKALAMTYDDYVLLPDDGYRYEILDGDLVMTPAPNPRHQNVLLNLASVIREWVASADLGKVYIAPIDVLLERTIVVQPDLLFIQRERLQIVTERGIEGAPDLVVEILSPGTAQRDRLAKARIYARRGVGDYWIVDPDRRTLEAFHLAQKRYRKVASLRGKHTLHPVRFPNLVISLPDLWK